MPETFAHLEETKNALTKQVVWQTYEIEELRGALETIVTMLEGQTSAVAASLRAVAQSSLDCTGEFAKPKIGRHCIHGHGNELERCPECDRENP